MKIRIGYVSNSSSSSFVIFKPSLSEIQLDMILDYVNWVELFIKCNDNNEDYFHKDDFDAKENFSYYNDLWRIGEEEDYIFGETSMDNFNFSSYLEYINVDSNFIEWDDGYNDKPYQSQLDFIKKMKKKYRKDKIDKINKSEL